MSGFNQDDLEFEQCLPLHIANFFYWLSFVTITFEIYTSWWFCDVTITCEIYVS